MCIPEFKNGAAMKAHSDNVSKLCNHKPKLNCLGAKVNPLICVNCGSLIKKGWIK